MTEAASIGLPAAGQPARLLKIIACEIAVREICQVAATSPNLVDMEFLTQGHHDVPCRGRDDIQGRVNGVPAGRYDAILIGYGLCSNMLSGLRATHTPLVIPRAHDCITLFLGSKERYQELFTAQPGSYYYTSGWLECVRRRGVESLEQGLMFMPSNHKEAAEATYKKWVEKYGEEQAQYLRKEMGGWSASYQRGVLIDFEFTQALGLREQVQRICTDQGWQYTTVPGDLSLFRRWVDGQWDAQDFLVVPPGWVVRPSNQPGIIQAEPAAETPPPAS